MVSRRQEQKKPTHLVGCGGREEDILSMDSGGRRTRRYYEYADEPNESEPERHDVAIVVRQSDFVRIGHARHRADIFQCVSRLVKVLFEFPIGWPEPHHDGRLCNIREMLEERVAAPNTGQASTDLD
jgi:hypothetical protein